MKGKRLAADRAETYFRLARAWQLKGNLTAAIAGFERVLSVDPGYAAAYVELGSIMLRQGRALEALRYLERAAEADSGNPTIDFRRGYVQRLLDHAPPTRNDSPVRPTPHLPDNPQGKIDLRDQVRIRGHRSGWAYALQALEPLHNRRGVLFDGFLERNFAWRHPQEGVRPAQVLQRMKAEGTFDELGTSEERGLTPYTRPWVGFLHNPPNMPTWFHYQESPQAIFAKDVWKQSLETCLGLFALSEYHGRWLQEQTGRAVSVLAAPSEPPAVSFSFKRFLANDARKIVQVGWWMRKLSAIYRLPIPRDNVLGYEKIRLVPGFFDNADRYLSELLAKDLALDSRPVDIEPWANTREMQHLADGEYDVLLSENIVFLELYDASANNAVIECIVRATPLLVNPLPAVVEYLGADYPMYFTDLEEAAEKALDRSVVYDAHAHLARSPMRERLSAESFRRSFETSEVYRSL